MTFTAHSLPEADLTRLRALNTALSAMPHPDVTVPGVLDAMRATGTQVEAASGAEQTALTPLERTIEGPSGELTLRIFRPEGAVRAVLFNIHGGGFVMGMPSDDDSANDLTARSTGVATVSVGYRLAPEHPFPAAVDDCVAAIVWLAAHSAAEFGTERLLIAGNSAGGYYAAQTLLRLKASHPDVLARIEGASLVFGVYDLGLTPSVRNATDETLVLTGGWIHQFFDLAFPGLDGEQRRDPALSPLHADLSGLPPALFTVGDLDPLLDDSLFMAARWQAAGNSADAEVWPSSPHGFLRMTPPSGDPAQARINAWFAEVLDA